MSTDPTLGSVAEASLTAEVETPEPVGTTFVVVEALCVELQAAVSATMAVREASIAERLNGPRPQRLEDWFFFAGVSVFITIDYRLGASIVHRNQQFPVIYLHLRNRRASTAAGKYERAALFI